MRTLLVLILLAGAARADRLVVRSGWSDFYRDVGRPDLARSYERRQAARAGLVAGGLLVAFGGLLWTGIELGRCNDERVAALSFEPCHLRWEGFAVAGLGLAASGIGALAIDPHPVSDAELRRLAAGRGLAIAPYAGPGGGGLLVTKRF